jgi:hypothetical protein
MYWHRLDNDDPRDDVMDDRCAAISEDDRLADLPTVVTAEQQAMESCRHRDRDEDNIATCGRRYGGWYTHCGVTTRQDSFSAT